MKPPAGRERSRQKVILCGSLPVFRGSPVKHVYVFTGQQIVDDVLFKLTWRAAVGPLGIAGEIGFGAVGLV